MDTDVWTYEADSDKVDILVWDIIIIIIIKTQQQHGALSHYSARYNLYLNHYYKSNKRHKVVWCIIHLLWNHVRLK